LNLRNVEDFQDALICQYRGLIREAVIESTTDFTTRMDLSKLNAKLRVITKAAHIDGLADNVISQLISEALPYAKAG
jgi:hypothetical protein